MKISYGALEETLKAITRWRVIAFNVLERCKGKIKRAAF
jgi:hypothetical protein